MITDLSQMKLIASEPAGSLAQNHSIRLAEDLRRLSDLVHADAEFEPGFERPTQAAYDFAWSLLTETAIVSNTVREAIPSTLGDGGVVVEFMGGEGSVRLVIPPSVDGAYVYADGHILPAEPVALARKLESREK